MSERTVATGVVVGAYPERLDPPLPALDELADRLARPLLRRVRGRSALRRDLPERVARQAAAFDSLFDSEVRPAVDALRGELRAGGFQEAVLERGFALVSEVAERTIGQRPHPGQLLAARVMLDGAVAELGAGEGKTLAVAVAAATAALAGVPVHVVTADGHLARRDAEAMEPLYAGLGLSVGLVVPGVEAAERRTAYAREVVYCPGREAAFDYLKDRVALEGRPGRVRLEIERLAGRRCRAARLLHRGLHFAIVDDVDTVLIDEARAPLVISGRDREPAEEEVYRVAVQLARELDPGLHFDVDPRRGRIDWLEPGRRRLAELGMRRGGVWKGQRRREDLVMRALRALHLLQRDEHYRVEGEVVRIPDEVVQRLVSQGSWDQSLQPLLEAREEVPITGRQNVLARMSLQRFFRRYLRLAGTTATAREAAGELWSSYGLAVTGIEPRWPPRRLQLGERVFAGADEKWRAVAERVAELQARGRPVLVGTRSEAASRRLCALLEERAVPHQVVPGGEEGPGVQRIRRAGRPGRVTVATGPGGRGADIRLAPGVDREGGLHVIATERHEGRRLDRQLFGRCGRRGEPGSCEAMVSFEDDLFRAHAGPFAGRLAALASGSETPVVRRLRGWLMGYCQWRASLRQARARRDLYRLDSRFEALLAFSGRRS